MATIINPRVGTIGFVFKYNLVGEDGLPFDLTGFSANVVFKNPSQTVSTKTGVITSPATLGQVTYTTDTGDLTEPGTWRMQIVITDGIKVYKSTIQKVKVEDNL